MAFFSRQLDSMKTMKVFFFCFGFVFICFNGCRVNEPSVDERPEVRILSPTSATRIVDSTTIHIAATDDKGIVRVEVYIDGQIPSDGVILYEPYTYVWRTSSLPDSSVHQISVKAYDSDSNATATPSLRVVVYRFAPASLSAIPSADTMVTLSWNDNASIETGYQVFQDINDSGYTTT